MSPSNFSTDHRYKNLAPSWRGRLRVATTWLGIVGTALVSLVTAISLQTGLIFAAPAFTEQWTGSTSPYFNFLLNGGSTITSNVADAAASDGKIVDLTLPAFPSAGPGGGPNLQSPILYGFGTYETRMKTLDCSSQPNTGAISGFFTYLNDGADQNGNSVKDNSEIDFEWLCAEPNVVWLTMWTDYQDSPLAMKRVYRELDIASGTIRRTCYSEGFGACTQNLTGSPTEGSPSTIAGLSGYNSSAAYYTYGFTWATNRMTWYMYHPSTGAKIILWDYQGPTSRITQRPAYYMFNAWHTNNWPPPNNPNAVQQPNSPRHLKLDWVTYNTGVSPTSTPTRTNTATSPTNTPTRTNTPIGPTPTKTNTATGPTNTPTRTNTPTSGGTNLALGKIATGTSLLNPAFITDGDKSNSNNFGGLDLGVRSIVIDLGQSYSLTKVNVWHYFADARTYHDVIVQLSTVSNFSPLTTVFNNDTNNSAGQGTGTNAEYAESSAGKSITFSPVTARYIRLWSNGSSANAYNHYVEVEVYQ